MMSSNQEDSHKKFSIKSGDEFNSRSLDAFGCLESLEQKHKQWENDNKLPCYVSPEDSKISESDTETLFKKPVVKKLMKRQLVSPKRKLGKWTKYSLKDTPVTSDAQNTTVALDFIRNLRKQKQQASKSEDANDSKLTFCKPRKLSKYTENFSNKKFRCDVTNSVKLDHLEEK